MTSKIEKIGIFVKKHILFFVLAATVLLFSLTTKRFAKIDNLLLILKQISVVGVLTIGMTYILIGGNMDLSMGSIVSLTTVITVRMLDKVGVFPSILIAMVVGMLCGCVTGFLVGRLHLNGMITTLGMQNIIYSVALIYTGNMYYGLTNQDSGFSAIGRGNILGIPNQLLIYAALIIIFELVLTKSIYGKKLMSVGNNSICSNYSGISSDWVVFKSYVISGLCASIAGIILTSRSMAGQTDAGTGMEFDALTATILGGTSLLGGSGSVVKSFLGVLIIGVLKNGFVLLGWSDYIQWVSQCVIIVAVVWIDISSKRKVTK